MSVNVLGQPCRAKVSANVVMCPLFFRSENESGTNEHMFCGWSCWRCPDCARCTVKVSRAPRAGKDWTCNGRNGHVTALTVVMAAAVLTASEKGVNTF